MSFDDVHRNLTAYHNYRAAHQQQFPEFNTPFTWDQRFEANVSGSQNCLNTFAKQIAAKNGRVRVLCCGTRRSMEGRPTHDKHWFDGVPNLEFVMTDYQDGIDVDFVWDIHKDPPADKRNYFDIVINRSVLEHVKYPHLVSTNLLKTLTDGGVVFLATHQTFPLHGYVHDYFRFSVEALKAIFPKTMNCEVLQSYYEQPCAIMPVQYSHNSFNDVAESYMYCSIMVRKVSETPQAFIPDLEIT